MPTPFTFGADTINIPDGWDALNVGQLVKIHAIKNYDDIFAVLSALTGMSEKKLKRADLDSFNYKQLMASLEWIATTPVPDFGKKEMPEVIVFGGKELRIPTDLNLKTFQQRYEFEQAALSCIKETGDIVAELARLLAIYFQPIYTGKQYDGDNLEPYIEMANELKAVDAYPIGSFFFQQFLKLTRTKQPPLKELQSDIPTPSGTPELNASKSSA